VTVSGRLAGVWTSARGVVVLNVEVAADDVVEMGGAS